MERCLTTAFAVAFALVRASGQDAFAPVTAMSDKEFKKTAINMPAPKGDKRGQSGPFWPAYNGQVGAAWSVQSWR